MRWRAAKLGVAAQQDVGAAAGHVGRDGDRADAARLGDDLGLALVVLGVQHLVRDAPALQRSASRYSDFSIETVPTSTGWPGLCRSSISSTTALNLALTGLVDHVRVVDADHRAVGGDGDDVEAVDLPELLLLGQGRAGHAGQLLVHAEVVLEGDGGQGLVLLLDLDALPWPRPPGAGRRDQRRPSIRRPVNSSTMMTSPSFTT